MLGPGPHRPTACRAERWSLGGGRGEDSYRSLGIQNPPKIPGKEVFGSPKKTFRCRWRWGFKYQLTMVFGCLGDDIPARNIEPKHPFFGFQPLVFWGCRLGTQNDRHIWKDFLYIFQSIIFGIYVNFFGGVNLTVMVTTSNWSSIHWRNLEEMSILNFLKNTPWNQFGDERKWEMRHDSC